MAERHQTNDTVPLKAGEKFTLEDWRKWPEGERWELIDGEASKTKKLCTKNTVCANTG